MTSARWYLNENKARIVAITIDYRTKRLRASSRLEVGAQL